MSITDFQEGTLPASDQEAQQLQEAGFQKCHNQLCNYHISPDVLGSAWDSQDGDYTCAHCGLKQDVLKAPGQPGGATSAGININEQGQIGEDLVEHMGQIPGYGPILWWHKGGSAVNSPADGMVPGWLIEVKTVNWNTQRKRGIINTNDRAIKLKAVQDPKWFAGQVNDPELDEAIHALGNVKGLLGILVLLDFDKGTADIYARPMPHDPDHQHGGIINFSQTGATQIASDVPFQSTLPDPRQESFIPYWQKQLENPQDMWPSLSKIATDYYGPSYIGQTPQIEEDNETTQWAFGQPPNIVGDDTKNDPAEYTEEHNFFFGNGQLHVSPDHDISDLQEHAQHHPDNIGPQAEGKVTVINRRATWHVNTNIALATIAKLLKDYTKQVGWAWGGMTDLEGQPINDDFAPKRSMALGPDHPDYDPWYDELAAGWRKDQIPLYHTAPASLRKQIQQEGLRVMHPNAGENEPGVYVEGDPDMAREYWGEERKLEPMDIWQIDQAHIQNLMPDYRGQAAYIPHNVPPEALSLYRDSSWHLGEYPGGSDMNDMMKKHYQNDGEDLELKNLGDIDKPEEERDQATDRPYMCPECGEKSLGYDKFINHLITEHEHLPTSLPKEDGHAPEAPGNPDVPLQPRFQPYPQFYESSWHLAGDPKDNFSSPIPFIYDIDNDFIQAGFPGQGHNDIIGNFTPGGILQGDYEPGGKMILRTTTDRPYSLYHLVDLWYHHHPHLEVTGVHRMDDQGKKTRLANDPVQKVKFTAAMDPAVSRAYKSLEAAGGRVYVVGGAIRDALKGEDPKDIDLMVTGLPADATRRVLESLPGRVDITGKDFGVFRYKHKGHDVEIALPRRERSTGVGHQDFDVQADHTMTPEEDLARRDFTVNAMAVPLSEHRLIDPFGGAGDIRSGTLRAIGDESLSDDPLRVLRALTANARHGFEPDTYTRRQMEQNAHGLGFLPKERLQMELDKIMSARNPARAMQLAHETGVLGHIFPEVESAFGYNQNNPHHNYDLGTHLINVLDNVSKVTNDPTVRLAALLHDIGKPASAWTDPQTGSTHYYAGPDGQGADHEHVGAQMAEERLRDLKFPNSVTNRVKALIAGHMFPAFSSLRGARKFLNRVGDENADDLLTLREADMDGKGTDEYQATKTPVDTQRSLVQQVREDNQPTGLSSLAINGNDLIQLGIQPGPLLGQKLKQLSEAVISDPTLNNRETLLELARDGSS